jgi:hypothetical protein
MSILVHRSRYVALDTEVVEVTRQGYLLFLRAVDGQMARAASLKHEFDDGEMTHVVRIRARIVVRDTRTVIVTDEFDRAESELDHEVTVRLS